MVNLMILLALGLASSEKLDRTYLPPPGSKFAGGSPGDLQVPLEPPKESFLTTLRQSERNDGLPTLGDSQVELGISRGIPDLELSTSRPDVPITYFQNGYNVPTTTTSYAFSQTTTLPPGKSYDIITGPFNPTTGLPSQNPTGIFQTTIRTYPQEQYNQNPDYVQYGPQSTTRPEVSSPGNNLLSGYVYQTPEKYATSNVRPNIAFGNTVQAPGYEQTYNQQDLAQNPYGRPVNIGQQIIPSTVSPTNTPIQRLGSFEQQKLSQYPQGQVSPNMGQLNFVPSTIQDITGPKSGITSQYYNDVNIQPFGPYDGTIQGVLPGQDTTKFLPGSNAQSNQPTYGQNTDQSNDTGSFISQPNPSTNVPLRDSNAFKEVQNVFPTTTAAPGTALPNFSTFSGIPSSTTSVPSGAFYPSGAYSAASTISSAISNQDTTSIRYKIRPERPQAETDRNAVILNNENVRTPEGYSYSFDTSNGIHADESGVVMDGTKAQGSYSYIGDDGKLYSVIYTADENGFQPRGDHLPTSPPIPEAIQRVIEQAARDRAAGISDDDGSYDETKYGHQKYQGKYHPQDQEKTFNNGADIPDMIENQFSGIKNKQFKPQKGQIRPVSTTEDYEINNYGNRQVDYENDDIIKNDHNKQFDDSNQPIDDDTPDSTEGNILTQVANAGFEKRPFKYPGSQHNGQDLTQKLSGFDKLDGHLDSLSGTDNDYNKDIFASVFEKPMRKQSVLGRPDKNDQVGPITTYKEIGINPQSSQSSGSSTDNTNVFDNRQTNVPSGFDNKNNPRNEFTTHQPIHQKTGYQYTRPESKITQEENRFPSRFIEINKAYSTRKPSASASTTAKPFITPNIYQNDEEIEDETDEQTLSKKPIYPISTASKYDEGLRSEYEQSTTPDQIIGDDEISYTTVAAPRKSKPSFNRRPSYSAQTTTTPNLYQNAYDNGSPHVNQKGTLRPGQGGNRYPSSTTFSTQTPGFVSSTTPMPSTYTTTLTPQRTSANNRYQTTYKPTARPNFSDMTIPPGLSSSMRSGSSVTPSELPESTISSSTTFRPNYDVRGETVSKLPPDVKVDGFGRPIEQFNQYSDGKANPSITTDYPLATNQDTKLNRPSSEVRSQRPGLNEGTNTTFIPGVVRFGQQTTSVPGLNTRRPFQGYNQSTRRVIGEDFSGPKRPQTFDPETGYHYK